MSKTSRTAILTKVYRVLKKRYKARSAHPDRPVLDHLLFACCLENSHWEPAEEALAAVKATFFDWNEIRVSMVKELSEVMHVLADPQEAAGRLRRTLQSVFESTYSFDVENLKKLNLGQAVKRLERLDGTTPFVVAVTTQAALGGHAIGVNEGSLHALEVLGAIDAKERAKSIVPGLERAIPKSKGVEFFSLLHQLGVDFRANPYSRNLHKVLLEINPACKPNLPRKLTKKQIEAARRAEAEAAKEAAAEEKRKREPVAASGKSRGKKTAPARKTEAARPRAAGKKKTTSAAKKRATAGGKKTARARITRRKPR